MAKPRPQDVYLQKVQTDYKAYCCHVHNHGPANPAWIPGRFHVFLCDVLQEFVERETDKAFEILVLNTAAARKIDDSHRDISIFLSGPKPCEESHSHQLWGRSGGAVRQKESGKDKNLRGAVRDFSEQEKIHVPGL